MGKKFQEAKVESIEEVTGVLIDDRVKLIEDCKEIIGGALSNPNIGFTDLIRIPGHRFLCRLTGIGATSAEAKYHYQVIPFFESEFGKFWITVSIELEFLRGFYRIANVSVITFIGDATDNRKVALLRAEWACTPEDINAPHAQPHWHIYPSQINREMLLEKSIFSEEIEVNSLETVEFNSSDEEMSLMSEWERSERFHFAMASRWHENGRNSRNEEVQALGILNWLDGCIRYTIQQMEYIYKKR